MMRVYRWLLRLFPREFRDTFGADMEALLREQLRAAGVSRRRRARVWVGGVLDVVTQGWAEQRRRRAAGSRRAGALIQDARLAVRSLRRTPGFAAVSLLTLMLGTGATAAVFSVVNALLLRPLPFPQPGRLVAVWPEKGFNAVLVHRLAQRLPALQAVAGVGGYTLTLAGDRGVEPRQINALLVTPNYLDVLGVRPVLGRGFAPGEDGIGSSGVVLLSYELWLGRFGGDRGVLGREIALAGADHETRVVIGVLPPLPRAVGGTGDVWVPLQPRASLTVADGSQSWVPLDPGTAAYAADGSYWVNLCIGRLAPGATREQATAQLRAAAAALQRESPTLVRDEEVRTASVRDLRSALTADTRPALWVLFGAVGLVLLIGCANLANLMLARGEARQRELSLRGALGAGRGRIIGMLLTEALVLSLAGGAAGLVLARVLLRVITLLAPPQLGTLDGVAINGGVLTFAFAVSVGAALLFGTVPAVRAGRLPAGATLRQGGRGTLGMSRKGAVSRTLVALELALAIVVVVASLLMVRSLRQLWAVDPGFRADRVLVMRPSPAESSAPNAAAYLRFYDRVLERVRALPGVETAAAIQVLPATGSGWQFPTFVEGQETPAGTPPPAYSFRVITPDYFTVLDIPLLGGRTIASGDRAGTDRVMVVNHALATLLWPGQDAIGRRIRMFDRTGAPFTVVGVVGDTRQRLNRPAEPELYVALAQIGWEVTMNLVLRTRPADPMTLAPAARATVWSIDPQVPITQLGALRDVVGRGTANTRFLTLLLAAFGGLALLLGAIGVYGVTAYTVARRIPEFGVRMALGAGPAAVMGSSLRSSMPPVFAGLALGLIGGLVGGRLLRDMLFGVDAHDPLTFLAVTLALLAVAMLAILVPARRATRVDPASILRGN